MGIIRNQGIKTSLLTYIGFGFGAINMLLFAKLVDPEILGLTRFFVSVAVIIFAISNMGGVAMMNKFYPYYRDYLPPAKRDMLGLVLILAVVGFSLSMIGAFFLQDLVIQKFGTKSKYVIDYYYFLLPFSFFPFRKLLLQSIPKCGTCFSERNWYACRQYATNNFVDYGLGFANRICRFLYLYLRIFGARSAILFV
jgi:O-antigen/teichoic acid export membrane protein